MGLESPHVFHGRMNMLEWDMEDGLCPTRLDVPQDSTYVSHRQGFIYWGVRGSFPPKPFNFPPKKF